MFKFFEYKIDKSEFITGNSYIDISEQCDAIFCKTDYVNSFKNKNINIFITHNSDYHITQNIIDSGPNFNIWFAQNKDVVNDNVFSIPIGLENTSLRTSYKSNNGLFSSEVNGALQKAILIDKINSYDFEKNKLVYLNFNPNTFPQERNYVLNKYSNLSWVTHTKNLPIENLYFDIAQHKFVFSPRGNGVDCHRTWEALYLRTIPIVKKSIHMNEFKELPILFVDNWEDINEQMLHSFYDSVKSKLYNLNELKFSYWKQKILSYGIT